MSWERSAKIFLSDLELNFENFYDEIENDGATSISGFIFLNLYIDSIVLERGGKGIGFGYIDVERVASLFSGKKKNFTLNGCSMEGNIVKFVFYDSLTFRTKLLEIVRYFLVSDVSIYKARTEIEVFKNDIHEYIQKMEGYFEDGGSSVDDFVVNVRPYYFLEAFGSLLKKLNLLGRDPIFLSDPKKKTMERDYNVEVF